jgi:hypothetical protein
METSTMPHHNSVLHDLLKPLSWGLLDRLAARHGSDADGRDLTTRGHLVALLYAQLSGATSLREIEAGLRSHAAGLYHLGAAAVARSTLAEANRYRSAAVFVDLFAALAAQLPSKAARREFDQVVRLIDATPLRLSDLSRHWAGFSAGVCGAKAHVIYDPDADRPLYAAVTPANVNDITAAKAMPIEPGATYVFDLGYYDYGWWAKLHHAGCRIVTRFKSNTPLKQATDRPLPPGATPLSDRVGHLPGRQAGSRKHPMADAVREIRVKTEQGKTLRLLTNDLDASAQVIADLYKRRWAIELFFRWIKQTLRIRHFFGTSENAVRIQIAVAFIAFLLLRLAQQACPITKSPLTFARLVRSNLMHRRNIDRLLAPEPTHRPDPRQTRFDFAPPSLPLRRAIA